MALPGDPALARQDTPPVKQKKPNKKPSAGANPAFSGAFIQALGYAARVHAGQIRKRTGRPYIGHLLGVTSIVIEYGGDEEMAIAALLHDAVEDQGGLPRLQEIQRKFGKRVAHIVDGCTDAYTDPKPPWLERKRAYVERVAGEGEDVRLVSAADKLFNTRETLHEVRVHGESVFERFAGEKDGTLWYYREVVSAFRKAENNPLIDELDRVVTELEILTGGRKQLPED
jgi:(p)ppGpp synthase/HD superfamily hydrolase